MNELTLRNKALATIARMAVDALGADPEMLDSPVSLVGHLVKHLDHARSEVKRLTEKLAEIERECDEYRKDRVRLAGEVLATHAREALLESRCLHLEAQLAKALGKEDRP